RRYFRVRDPIRYEEKGVILVALPHDGLRVSFTIEYENAFRGTQYATYDIDPDTFIREIAPARTFVLERDVEALRARGMIQGGTLQNAVVVQPGGILNKEPLRFEDEFVRHKILDFLGDLTLLGRPARGHFLSMKSGHATNVRFVQRMVADEEPGSLIKGVGKNGDHGPVQLDIMQIQQIMPHRYPLLLIDRILSLEEHRVVGIKNVTINEPFFNRPFPAHPITRASLRLDARGPCACVVFSPRMARAKAQLISA